MVYAFFLSRSDPPEALATLDALMETAQSTLTATLHAQLLCMRAWIRCVFTDKLEDALADLDTALARDSGHLQAYYLRARVLQALKRLPDALQVRSD